MSIKDVKKTLQKQFLDLLDFALNCEHFICTPREFEHALNLF